MIQMENIIENNEDVCFICLYNDNELHDFPCKNCKLKIHLECFHNYLKTFENNKICSVCKNNMTIEEILIQDNDSDDNFSDSSDELEEYTYANIIRVKIKRLFKCISKFLKNLFKIITFLCFNYFLGFIVLNTFNLPLKVIDNKENSIFIFLLNILVISLVFSFFSILLFSYIHNYVGYNNIR